MARNVLSDLTRLEIKLNLLNDKLDRLMEAQGVTLVKAPEVVDKEEEKKRKARERQQQNLLRKENLKRRLMQHSEDIRLKYSAGFHLQSQFNLLHTPSAARIREYQRTKSPDAFKGLKKK